MRDNMSVMRGMNGGWGDILRIQQILLSTAVGTYCVR